MLFYCFIVFFFLQTNKQINCQVKTLERKTNKINSLLAEDQNADCFFFFLFFSNLNKTDFYSNGPCDCFNTPELTGKACAPSPDGRIDWEMTEEEDIKKKKRCSDK